MRQNKLLSKYCLAALCTVLFSCASGPANVLSFPGQAARTKTIQDLIPLEEYKTLSIVDFQPPARGAVPDGVLRNLSQCLSFYCDREGVMPVDQMARRDVEKAPGKLVLSGRIVRAAIPEFPPRIGDRTILVVLAQFTSAETGALLGEIEVTAEGYLDKYPYDFQSETREAAKAIIAYMKRFREN